MVFWNNRWNTVNSILVIVEGTTDIGFIEGITERLQVTCRVHLMRGNRPEKASRILVALQGEFERAIVLKDLHREGRNRVALIHKLTDKAKQLEKQGLRLHIITIKWSIESWILAGLSVNNPEEILDPEEELKRLMKMKGEQFIKSRELYRKLAREIVDIKKAMIKSESFRNFIKILTTIEDFT
jgi:hypothetical protein